MKYFVICYKPKSIIVEFETAIIEANSIEALKQKFKDEMPNKKIYKIFELGLKMPFGVQSDVIKEI